MISTVSDESNIPSFPLGSTEKGIPRLGLGTAEYPFGSSLEAMKETILQAIELGYRHFDTAALYHTEQPFGEAISDALRLGLITSRDELFITSKLWCSDAHRDCILPTLQKTLKYIFIQKIYILDKFIVLLSKKQEIMLPINNTVQYNSIKN